MKKKELEAFLKNSGAAYLEKITHFDGDSGRWVVRAGSHVEVKVPFHHKELLHRISKLDGVKLVRVEHPRWKGELKAFERANNAVLDHEGGHAFNAAFNRWAELCETPGDNMKLIVWGGGEK